jgi:acetylornithine aminotransferase
MIGIDLSVPHKDIRSRLIHEEHVFTGCAGTNTLRLLPPLCLTKANADEFMQKFRRTLGA